jgi:hypothetical protein
MRDVTGCSFLAPPSSYVLGATLLSLTQGNEEKAVSRNRREEGGIGRARNKGDEKERKEKERKVTHLGSSLFSFVPFF